MNKQQLITELKKIEAVQYGEFTLKSGEKSNVYADLRRIISFPETLKLISAAFAEMVKEINPELICGVPYAALPLASALSLDTNIPMIMYRKETKAYGTKKQIEGVFSANQSCVIIEDVVTSGGSILTTAECLKEHGLNIEHVFTIVNREQGGAEKLREQGYQLHSLLTLSDLTSEGKNV
ncbi:orotate phosphoribosyltransferase [Piscirickettsia litoralis]|uniref:Orotate phosphoribosyltransferase n=1 Tax=Piscirickettsia litoralis TaxID=1891921 RepID=A0ABX3A460_9GAMM|nr:orotate phosphoribosyltransferase [Piscirickettsia litoralis]ODN43654.1 orotate phosphoribosyltransferase [Piscirickettsia litoralis]